MTPGFLQPGSKGVENFAALLLDFDVRMGGIFAHRSKSDP